jgi:hypothetical protein
LHHHAGWISGNATESSHIITRHGETANGNISASLPSWVYSRGVKSDIYSLKIENRSGAPMTDCHSGKGPFVRHGHRLQVRIQTFVNSIAIIRLQFTRHVTKIVRLKI